MRKFLAFLWLSLLSSIWFSFASNPVIIDPSYAIHWDNVTIYRTDASDWWYVDISVRNPGASDWIHIWTANIKDQEFTYLREWKTTQKVLLTPDNWGDSVQMSIWEDTWTKSKVKSSETITRTVITAVPKTWPSVSLIWVILATLAIFGGYIYIKKRAGI